MLTAKDIDLMKQFFITKDEFTNAHQELRNDILNFKDEILTEVVSLRQETDINSSFRNRIEKQDKRIDRLESAVFN